MSRQIFPISIGSGGTPGPGKSFPIPFGHYQVQAAGATQGEINNLVSPLDGTLSNLCVYNTSPDSITSGLGLVYTVQKNGVDTPLSVINSGTSTYGLDTSNQVVFVRGDRLLVNITTSGTSYGGNIAGWRACIENTPATAGQHWFHAWHFLPSSVTSGFSRNLPMVGRHQFSERPLFVVPVSGTVKAPVLQTYSSAKNGTDNLTSVFTLMVNSTASPMVIACTSLSNTSATAIDTSGTVITVTQGDSLHWNITLSGVGTAAFITYVEVGCIFEASDTSVGIFTSQYLAAGTGYAAFHGQSVPNPQGSSMVIGGNPITPIFVRRSIVKAFSPSPLHTENCMTFNLEANTTTGLVDCKIIGLGYAQVSTQVQPVTSSLQTFAYKKTMRVEGLWAATTADVCVVTLYTTDTTSTLEEISTGITSFIRTTNDDFVLATPVTQLGQAYTAYNGCATYEVSEPTHGGDSIATKSMWWSWNPGSFTGTALATVITNTTSGSSRGVFAAYLGTTVSALTLVASNSGTGTVCSFPIIPNTTYRLAMATGANRWLSISMSGTFEAVVPETNTNDSWNCMAGLCFDDPASSCPVPGWTVVSCP